MEEEVIPDGVLGMGGSSTGWMLVSGEKGVYLPNRAPDLDKTLDILLNLISTLASGIKKANMGGDIITETFTSDLANLTTEVNKLKEVLK